MKVIPFSNLISRYRGFLLDAFGVFWGSNEFGMLPNAAEAMQALVAQGKTVGILSNSTQLSAKEQAKLEKRGVFKGVHYHFFLTSGQVTRDLLLVGKLPFATPRKTYWLSSPPHPRFALTLFEGTAYREVEDLKEADFIYLSTPHLAGVDQEKVEVFREFVQHLKGPKLPVLCANPDPFAHDGVPLRLVVRQGSMGKLFEEEGFPVYYIGKPGREIFLEALSQFPKGTKTEEVLMIGDTPETDIRGARSAGIPTALVTKTGIFAARLQSGSNTQLRANDQPDFFIDRFAMNLS